MKTKTGFGAIAIGAFLLIQGCEVQYGYTERGWNTDGGHYHNGRYYGRNHDHSRGYYGDRDARQRVVGGRVVIVRGGYVVNQNPDSAEQLAKDYGIRYESAVRILDLTDGQDSKDDLKAVGLKVSDLKVLKDSQLPSYETIQKIAEATNESSSKIQGVMEGFILDTQR
jgi:hypothetical protein